MTYYNQTAAFLNEVFGIPHNLALALKAPHGFVLYGLWKEMTEEQFATLYDFAQEGKYGDFFYVAEEMNKGRKKRLLKKNGEKYLQKMREDPVFRRIQLDKKNEWRRKRRQRDD